MSAHTDLVRNTIAYLKRCGLPARKLPGGKVRFGTHTVDMGEDGWPDVLAILKPAGRALMLECKTGEGRVRDGQSKQHDALRNAGAIVGVVRSIEDVQRIILEVTANERGSSIGPAVDERVADAEREPGLPQGPQSEQEGA